MMMMMIVHGRVTNGIGTMDAGTVVGCKWWWLGHEFDKVCQDCGLNGRMDQEINVIIPLVAYLIIMNNVVVVVLVAIGRCIRVMMKYGPMTHVDPCDRPQRLFGNTKWFVDDTPIVRPKNRMTMMIVMIVVIAAFGRFIGIH